MKRNSLNFVIDLVAFLNLLGLVFTGFIMEYILPPGTGGCGRAFRGGRGPDGIRDLWSMTRHQWGDIHYYLAILFVILMLVHIILHFGWIKNYLKSLFGSAQKQN